jgi:hypothetical protein
MEDGKGWRDVGGMIVRGMIVRGIILKSLFPFP